MRLFLLACDRTNRTVTCTFRTSFTFLRIDLVNFHCLADMGTAFTLYDVFDIFVTEVLERTEDRKRCTLAKSAERTRLDEFRCFFQFVKVFHLALAVCDLLKEFEHTLRSDSARTAFSAGFSLSESHEEFRNIDHTGALVHNNQTAGTDDRIVFLNLVKIKRNVQILLYETSTGRSTNLNTLEYHK